MTDTLKFIVTGCTFLIAWVAPIYLLRIIGTFDSAPTEKLEILGIAISVSGFIFSLFVSYIVGNLCEGTSISQSWSNITSGGKFIPKALWGIATIILVGWLVYFLYTNMPLWALVVSVLLFVNVFKK